MVMSGLDVAQQLNEIAEIEMLVSAFGIPAPWNGRDSKRAQFSYMDSTSGNSPPQGPHDGQQRVTDHARQTVPPNALPVCGDREI